MQVNSTMQKKPKHPKPKTPYKQINKKQETSRNTFLSDALMFHYYAHDVHQLRQYFIG